MTIEKEPGRQYFSCDEPGCKQEFEFDPDNFSKDWQRAKNKGWESKRIGQVHNSEWFHACPKHML